MKQHQGSKAKFTFQKFVVTNFIGNKDQFPIASSKQKVHVLQSYEIFYLQ